MLQTYQFKTHCKGDINSSKTANIILPGLPTGYRWTPLRVQIVFKLKCIHGCWLKQLNNSCRRVWMLLRLYT